MDSRLKRTSAILLLLAFVRLTSWAQVKAIGVPEIINIHRWEYGADAQNWAIIEDDQGSIYMGNNAGVLKFNGEQWRVFPVENRSIVRSLMKGPEGEIYVGAYNEIGMMTTLPDGAQVYRSLNSFIPDSAKNFDDVWNIYMTDEGPIFQSFEYLFIYRDDSIRVLQPEDRFGNAFVVEKEFYVVEKGVGLRVLQEGTLKTVSADPVFSSDEIRALFPWEKDELLVGTLNRGLIILKEGKITEWQTPVSDELKQNKLYSALSIREQFFFGTIRNGLYICDREGRVTQHLSRSNGLQNNTVLSLHIDRQYNTWIGLDNGIDYLKTSLPISYLNYNFNIETVYASIHFRDRLYVGTNQGLYTKRLSELGKISDIGFDLVEGTEGQVWDLAVFDNQLLCGHHNGAFRIEGTQAIRITERRGIWNFHRVPGRQDLLISGTYDGLITFSKDAVGNWTFRKPVEGLDVSSIQLILEDDATIWMSHGYLGLYQIKLNSALDSVTSMQVHFHNNGLPETLPYLLHRVAGQFFISTVEGIFQHNAETGKFVKPPDLNNFYSDLKLIFLLMEDPQQNIWYSSDRGMGVFRRLEDGTYTKITVPFLGLRNALISPFDNIHVMDPGNIFIGTQNGLVHYDPEISKNYFYPISAYIDEVAISAQGNDSLWFFKGNGSVDGPERERRFSLPYQFNTISFSYHCSDLENAGLVEYSYRLTNFDQGWSDWSRSNTKEYTNLREGPYLFEIRARNIYGNISEPDRFHFFVHPPFYRSTLALVLYILFALGLTGLLLMFYLKRIERVRTQEKSRQMSAFKKKEEILQEQRAAAEKKVIQLKNEKLVSEMKYKNKELVNSTFHLIQKNKFLNALKLELAKLSKSAKSDQVEKELRKISRKIDRDIQNEKNWEVFERYFDEVHQEFLHRLKEKHPDLTPGELRLCAYLRMNISTKEIAPLMNISVRGVEISRYRLRKKLDLPHEANLATYIMSI